MTKINLTFCRGRPGWANACVGDNGSSRYRDYARGYSHAALLLIDQVLQDHESGSQKRYYVDEFVYPVCFNMRHSVELRLKDAITEIQRIERIRDNRLNFDLSGSHDIGLIWGFFSDKSRSIDDRYNVINAKLEPRIIDFAEVDATGQTFRYPMSIEGKKHLVDINLINFFNLKNRFKALETDLDELEQLNTYLIHEYDQGSFTKNLSRNRIFKLALRLPERSKWTEDDFTSIKSEIRKSFGISGRELSDGINIIENNFEFSPIIGVELPLLGISEEDIECFVIQWLRLHETKHYSALESVEAYDVKPENLDALFKNEIEENIWSMLSASLTPEILAGLTTLFYFRNKVDSIDECFSEIYRKSYQRNIKESEQLFSRSKDAVRNEFFHLLKKTNAINNFLMSLYFLKKNRCADSLVAAHDLANNFYWLDDARSGRLFEKPSYCGYTLR